MNIPVTVQSGRPSSDIQISAEAEQDVVFGDEGQGWMLLPPQDFVTSSEAVPHFASRVGDYLKSRVT